MSESKLCEGTSKGGSVLLTSYAPDHEGVPFVPLQGAAASIRNGSVDGQMAGKYDTWLPVLSAETSAFAPVYIPAKRIIKIGYKINLFALL